MSTDKSEIVAGISKYNIDSDKYEMTITIKVISEDFGVDQYKEVYDQVKKTLDENFRNDIQTNILQK